MICYTHIIAYIMIYQHEVVGGASELSENIIHPVSLQ